MTPTLDRPSTSTAPALPDVNHEIHPFPVVQHLLDQTADFCLFAVPEETAASRLSLTPSKPDDFFGINGGYGIAFRSSLHAFNSQTRPGSGTVDQITGGRIGKVTGTCLFGPDDLRWSPDREPNPRIYDPYRSRRFTIQDLCFEFGEEKCTAYGIGRTYPASDGKGPVTRACGVGNVTGGTRGFGGLEGSFVMTGFFTPGLGFRGEITLRLVDPAGRIRSGRDMTAHARQCDPATGSSFFVFRGEKKDRHVRTEFGPPRGNEMSLITPSIMRAVELQCATHERAGVRTGKTTGPVAAGMIATVYFNLLAPPGTAALPVPFTTEEVYTFAGENGRTIGTIEAGVQDGISFNLRFAGLRDQPGVRFAGYGPITRGTGRFEGASGILTVNSLIGISPHALSLIHVLHLDDPEGRFRAMRPCRSL